MRPVEARGLEIDIDAFAPREEFAQPDALAELQDDLREVLAVPAHLGEADVDRRKAKLIRLGEGVRLRLRRRSGQR